MRKHSNHGDLHSCRLFIEKMHNGPWKSAHLILRLEWAKSGAPKDPASEGAQYRSVCWNSLAQDTARRRFRLHPISTTLGDCNQIELIKVRELNGVNTEILI